MVNGTLDCCERHTSTPNVIEAIQKYLARELAFCANTGDEYFSGVEATCLDIQDIINKGK